MSLWFAGAFEDPRGNAATGKRMTTQHPNAQTGGGNFWFGGDYEKSGNSYVPPPRTEYQSKRALSAGSATNRAGRRLPPTDILATQQNVVGGGCVVEKPLISSTSVRASSVSASTGVDANAAHHRSSRFNTPHRIREEQRGYSINPITLLPMTAGPSQVPLEVFQRFETDVKKRDFYAASSDMNYQSLENSGIGQIAAAAATSPTRIPFDKDVPQQAAHVLRAAAFAREKTVLYPDHNKEEQIFLQGCRKQPLTIEPEPVAHPSYATRMYPVKQDRGVPYDTTETFTQSATSLTPRSTTPTAVRTQRKMVPKPEGRSNINDEDNFLIKTSRNAPPTDRSEREGFAVLLSTDPGRQRNPLDGMRMSERPGKVTSDFVARTRNERLAKEQQLMIERRAKCAAAFEQERLRMATRKTHDESFMAAKGRAYTPPASLRAAAEASPFAVGLPAPHIATVGKSTHWWKR